MSIALTEIETGGGRGLSDDARLQLREQKIRLDREFGLMLSRIAERKENLEKLEVRLQQLDNQRHAKEEELKDLERKLVVLLEEQQRELLLIKQRQEASSVCD